MNITGIEATREAILLRTDLPDGARVRIRERAPLAGDRGRVLSETEAEVNGGAIRIDRFTDGHDRLYSAFEAEQAGTPVPGARYVTDFAADVPENTADYPQPDTIKALYGTEEDVRALGLKQSPCNINLPALMIAQPREGDIPYLHDGHTYYFRRDRVEALDAQMIESARRGILITMILLNSPRLFGSAGEEALLRDCLHPDYDWSCPDAYISAFNMRTEAGQGCYRAFVEFLAERYTRPDGRYGRVAGAIVSNEVNSQYVWGNAGEMTVRDYSDEYLIALRQTWLCGRKHCAHFRVYVSLDQHWCRDVHNPLFPLRYYPGRDVIDRLAETGAREGDFPWCVAYHPYPEDLRWPDFWHDRAPDFTFSTPKITFKNMEVLEAYLSQPQLLYRGAPRRIIFSEQGFNSHSGALQSLTERMAEAGYVLAYLKARDMKTVDMLMHHAYVDNPHEFGLNLGIRRYDPDAPSHAGEKKPIYEAIRDMDTENEPARVEKARAFIGPELFDYLLHPPLEYHDRDTSKDSEFGN